MQIKCDFYNYEYSSWHQYEIDMDLNVYPCCHYYTESMKNGKLDEPINHIDNNLKSNSLKNIFEDYNTVLNEKIWNNEKTCPPLCMRICQIA